MNKLEKKLNVDEIIKIINNNEVTEEELADYLIASQKDIAESDHIHCYMFDDYEMYSNLKNQKFVEKLMDLLTKKLKSNGYNVRRKVDGMWEYTRF